MKVETNSSMDVTDGSELSILNLLNGIDLRHETLGPIAKVREQRGWW